MVAMTMIQTDAFDQRMIQAKEKTVKLSKKYHSYQEQKA